MQTHASPRPKPQPPPTQQSHRQRQPNAHPVNPIKITAIGIKLRITIIFLL